MTGSDPDFGPDFSKALDRLIVPAPRAALIDEIVVAARTRQPWGRTLRDRRGGWLRGHRAFVATMAATIMSATAAAAAGGWLGEAGTRLPVIAQIATVMPEAVKAPSVRKAKATAGGAAAGAATGTAKPAAQIASGPEQVQEAVARPPRPQRAVDRIEARLDRRDARRAAMGLPADSARERVLLDRFKAADTPLERREVRQEARALRQEKRAARQALPICTGEQAANPAANGCRVKMTPERRAEIMERLCARMAENGRTPPRCRPIMKGGPEPLTEPTPE